MENEPYCLAGFGIVKHGCVLFREMKNDWGGGGVREYPSVINGFI